MPKSQAPHELLLLYAMGLRQKQLITYGYPPNTCWKYYQNYRHAFERIENMFNELIELRKKKSKAKIVTIIKPSDKRKKDEFAQEIVIEEKKKVEDE